MESFKSPRAASFSAALPSSFRRSLLADDAAARSPTSRSPSFSRSRFLASPSTSRLTPSSSGFATPFSTSPSPSGSPLLPSSSFVGSYEQSLMSDRLSAPPSKPVIFDAELGVLGSALALGESPKAKLRCPKHLTLPFPAHFHLLPTPPNAASSPNVSSPYVGTIDLESYYFNKLAIASDAASASGESGMGRALPTFPGYRVPPRGQIQLVIKNPAKTAVKVFLVPYDMTSMQAGQRTFVRQKCYAQAGAVPAAINGASRSTPAALLPQESKEPQSQSLRYAVHLQFCSPPASYFRSSARWEGAEGEAPPAPKVYLHRGIRVVFSPRLPDSSERLHTVTETVDAPLRSAAPDPEADTSALSTSPFSFSERVPLQRPAPPLSKEILFGSYAGPGPEWMHALKQARSAIKRASETPRHDVEPDTSWTDASSHAIPIERTSSRDRLGQPADKRDDASVHGLTPISDPNGERWHESTTPPMPGAAAPPDLTSVFNELDLDEQPSPSRTSRELSVPSSPALRPRARTTGDKPRGSTASSFAVAHTDDGQPHWYRSTEDPAQSRSSRAASPLGSQASITSGLGRSRPASRSESYSNSSLRPCTPTVSDAAPAELALTAVDARAVLFQPRR